MSKPSDPLHHPVNGMKEPTWEGFNWPAFFFGAFWLLVKGLYGQFVINVLLLLISFGFAAPLIWLFYGIKGNDLHRKSLLKKGYLSTRQWNDKVKQSQPAPHLKSDNQSSTTLLQLQQLGDLRSQGVLTEEEFLAQKNRLLSQQEVGSFATVNECHRALTTLGYIVKQVRENAWDISDSSTGLVTYARSFEQLQEVTRKAWCNQT